MHVTLYDQGDLESGSRKHFIAYKWFIILKVIEEEQVDLLLSLGTSLRFSW